MYEHITYEVLVKRMMERALESNKNLDSREGSLLFLGEAPAAVELQNLYIALDAILRETFADTASREYLIQRAMERGLSPLPATHAVLEMTITPAGLALKIGERFSIGELNYYVSEYMGGGVYAITCETAGEAGNNYGLTVIPIEYIPGLETCTITALLIPGEDEEDTEVFRRRYLNSLKSHAFGGNRADYVEKVNALPGVGGCRVYRAWNGGISPSSMIPSEEVEAWVKSLKNLSPDVDTWLKAVFNASLNGLLTVGGTVKIVVIDSTFSSPSGTLIDAVQTVIDPVRNAGEGDGLAPIGHVVKVFPVETAPVDLAFSITCQQSWGWEDVKPHVEQAAKEYFTELAKGWAEQEDRLIVRISQLESRLLNVPGILDITGTKLNGKAENLTLSADTIPVMGKLSVTVG